MLVALAEPSALSECGARSGGLVPCQSILPNQGHLVRKVEIHQKASRYCGRIYCEYLGGGSYLDYDGRWYALGDEVSRAGCPGHSV